MKFPKRIELCEVGPRDGLQSAKRRLPPAEKAILIDRAADAGFSEIEFGAFAEFKEVGKLDDTDQVCKLVRRRENVVYRVLVSSAEAVRRAADCGVDTVKISVFASEHIHGAIEDKLAIVRKAGETAASLNLRACGSISLPFSSPQDGIVPYENVYRISKAYTECGIRKISLGDAAGMADPRLVYERVTALKADFPNVEWVLHLHDTWGMGFANVIAGLQAGVTCFDSSFAGLGGCPFLQDGRGNIASEQMVYMMQCMGIETGVDLDKALELAKYVYSLDLGVTNSAYMSAMIARGSRA